MGNRISPHRLAHFRAIGRLRSDQEILQYVKDQEFSRAYVDQIKRSIVGLTAKEITKLLTMADADILRADRGNGFSEFMADVSADYETWLQSPAARALPAQSHAQLHQSDPLAEAIR